MSNLLKTGTQYQIVYDALLFHEYMNRSTIEEKTGLPNSSIAPVLTRLRRKGLVEGVGDKTNRKWKKYPIENPLYPPQPDFKKSSKKQHHREIIEASSDDIIKHIAESLQDLRAAIKRECGKNSEAEKQLDAIKKQLKLGD